MTTPSRTLALGTNDSMNKSLDIVGADDVEILISDDKTVVWVNTKYGCKLRICNIRGTITVEGQT